MNVQKRERDKESFERWTNVGYALTETSVKSYNSVSSLTW